MGEGEIVRDAENLKFPSPDLYDTLSRLH